MTLTFDAGAYTNLLVRHQPKPITTEAENEAAIDLAQKLEHRSRTPEEDLFLELLVTLIEKFEEEYYPIPEVPPNRIFRHFVEVGASTQAELANLIGVTTEEMAQFVSGQKIVDEAQAAILGDRFKVSPSLFRA